MNIANEPDGINISVLSNANIDIFPTNNLSTFSNTIPRHLFPDSNKQYAICVDSVNVSSKFEQNILPKDRRFPPIMCVPNDIEVYFATVLYIRHSPVVPMSSLTHFPFENRFYLEYKNYTTHTEVRDAFLSINPANFKHAHLFGVSRSGKFFIKLRATSYQTRRKYHFDKKRAQLIEKKIDEISAQQELRDALPVDAVDEDDIEEDKEKLPLHLLLNTYYTNQSYTHAYRAVSGQSYGNYVSNINSVITDLGKDNYIMDSGLNTLYLYKGFVDNWLHCSTDKFAKRFIDGVPYYVVLLTPGTTVLYPLTDSIKSFYPSLSNTLVLQCDQVTQEATSGQFSRNIAYITIDKCAKNWPFRCSKTFKVEKFCMLETNDLDRLTIKIRTLDNRVPPLDFGHASIVNLRLKEMPLEESESKFFITINSDDNIYGNVSNTVSNFSVKLPYIKTLYGRAEWKVGLSSLILPKRFPLRSGLVRKIIIVHFSRAAIYKLKEQNITSNVEQFQTDGDIDVPTTFTTADITTKQEETIPDYVHNVESFIFFLNTNNNTAKVLRASLVDNKTKFHLEFLHSNIGIVVHSELAYYMGLSMVGLNKRDFNFVNIIGNNESYTFPNSHRFNENYPSSLFVYSDIIAERLVGGKPLQVLKILPVSFAEESDVLHYEFENVQFHKITRKYLDILSFKITSHDGNDISTSLRPEEDALNHAILTLVFVK